MKIYILLDADYDSVTEVVHAYTTKQAAETHHKLRPGLLLRETELDGPLPEHENVTRYEALVITDLDNLEFKESELTISPTTERRGWTRTGGKLCFWSYESREDVLLAVSEFRQSEDFDEDLAKLQMELYGRVM